MKMERVMVQLPKETKTKLDGLRRQGTSISGFIRSIVEREFKHTPTGRKDDDVCRSAPTRLV